MAMKKVLVNFIQDRSGSMQSVWNETLNGFKKFVDDLRDNAAKDDVEYLFSLTVFDTQVETPLVAVPIASVETDILVKHGPRGSTALYDAVGATIKATDDNRHGAEKIIVVVVTDGQENSSREWKKDTLHQAIDSHLAAGDWTFTYLGTQPETWDDASAIGVGLGSIANYTGHMAGAAYAATSNAVRSLSASARMGSRSLMRDFVPQKVACASGMKIDYDDHTAPPVTFPRPTTVRPPTPKAVSERRWK